MTAEATLNQLVARLRQRVPGLVAVYRYGSFGTRYQRPDSDIDLGLLAGAPLDPVFLFDLAGELATAAARDVDLLDLIACATAMRAHVIASGERVFCSDATRCANFEATAYSRYAHLNEARRGILEDLVHGR